MATFELMEIEVVESTTSGLLLSWCTWWCL